MNPYRLLFLNRRPFTSKTGGRAVSRLEASCLGLLTAACLLAPLRGAPERSIP